MLSGHSHAIGILGVPGSGKTSLAKRIRDKALSQGCRVFVRDPLVEYRRGELLPPGTSADEAAKVAISTGTCCALIEEVDLDVTMGGRLIDQHPYLHHLLHYRRHYDVSCILVARRFTGLHPEMRNLLSWVFIGRATGDLERKWVKANFGDHIEHIAQNLKPGEFHRVQL